MKQATTTKKTKLLKKAYKIKINPDLDNTIGIEEAAFLKKKMAKGKKILAIAGLPK